MSIVQEAPARRASHAAVGPVRFSTHHLGLLAAGAVLVAVLLLPTPAGLPVAAHRMLALLAFAVIV